MRFLERMAMKVLERGMRNSEKPDPHIGEIVLSENPTPQQLEQMQIELLYYRRLAAQREAQLLELQRIDTLGNIEERHREKQIRQYETDIERLNLTIPGGLRSQPQAEPGEDQELVNEAWFRFCMRRRGGSSRLG